MHLGLQTLLALAQCVLLYMQEYRYKITTDRPHPLSGLGDALHTVRLQGHLARMQQARGAQEGLASSVKPVAQTEMRLPRSAARGPSSPGSAPSEQSSPSSRSCSS